MSFVLKMRIFFNCSRCEEQVPWCGRILMDTEPGGQVSSRLSSQGGLLKKSLTWFENEHLQYFVMSSSPEGASLVRPLH